MQTIQIIFAPGTFGNLLRWTLDRFSPDTKFKHIDDPWDNDHRVHSLDKMLYSEKFVRGHQVEHKDISTTWSNQNWCGDPSADKIVINFRLDDFLFQERCGFWRSPGMETPEGQHKTTIFWGDQSFIEKTFGSGTNKSSKAVAKELFKIQFHDHEKHTWWNNMKKFMADKNYYQFPVYALWNTEQFIHELENVSDRLSLGLVIDKDIVSKIVEKISKSYPVITKDRARDVLEAIEKNINIDCSEMDIVEQAWLETVLEKKHDCIVFPYGTNWFKDTDQIKEFLDTYPSYLKHMNPRLPWHNNNRNPFYLTGKIDDPK